MGCSFLKKQRGGWYLVWVLGFEMEDFYRSSDLQNPNITCGASEPTAVPCPLVPLLIWGAEEGGCQGHLA